MKKLDNYIIEKLKINKGVKDIADNPDDALSYKEKTDISNELNELTTYWNTSAVDKLYELTTSLLERYHLAKLIDYCRVNDNKYSNINNVLVGFTPKGNLAIYYNKHYLGTYSNNHGILNNYPITKEFLQKFNLYIDDNK